MVALDTTQCGVVPCTAVDAVFDENPGSIPVCGSGGCPPGIIPADIKFYITIMRRRYLVGEGGIAHGNVVTKTAASAAKYK